MFRLSEGKALKVEATKEGRRYVPMSSGQTESKQLAKKTLMKGCPGCRRSLSFSISLTFLEVLEDVLIKGTLVPLDWRFRPT